MTWKLHGLHLNKTRKKDQLCCFKQNQADWELTGRRRFL